MRIESVASMFFGPYQSALGFVPVVLQRLGGGPETVALYQAASYVGFLLSPITAPLIPARGAQRYLAAIWAAGRGIFALAGLALSAPAVVGFALVYFFLDSFPAPAYTRVIQTIYPARARARVMGFVRLGMAVSVLAFTPLAGSILDTLGHGWLFLICGLAGVVSALIFGRIRLGAANPKPVAAARRPLREVWRVAFADRRFRTYLLSVVAFGLGGLIPVGFYPSVIVNRLNLSYTELALLSTIQSIVWLCGYVVWGQLMDRFTGVVTLRALYLLMAIIPLSYIWASAGWMLLPSFICQGLGSAGIDLAFQSATIELAPEERAYEYAALQRSVIGMRGLIGPFIGVALGQLGLPAVGIFAIGSALYVLAGVLMLAPVFRAGRGR